MQKLETVHGSFTTYVNRLVTNEGIIFHISFVDNNNQTHIILIKKTFDGIEFKNPENLPDWVINIKSRLQALIDYEESEGLSQITIAV